jgi:hypothetical protein
MLCTGRLYGVSNDAAVSLSAFGMLDLTASPSHDPYNNVVEVLPKQNLFGQDFYAEIIKEIA